MKLHIYSQTTFAEINRFFRSQFPYLQLRFFTEPHREGEGSAALNMIQDVYASCDSPGAADYIANETLTAAQLESWFAHELGLFVQVFRKSGDVWLETTTPGDKLTLAVLNAKGREHEITPQTKPEPSDFREEI
jgi:hypothetical protein